MNEKLMNGMGFEKEIERVKAKKCPFCRKEIKEDEFKDDASKREFGISGLCQVCQDKMFG